MAELAPIDCGTRPAPTVACAGTRASRGSLRKVGCAAREASDALTVLGAPAGRRISSEVPHIPQKRKFAELFSPQFGQITMASPDLRYPIVPIV